MAGDAKTASRSLFFDQTSAERSLEKLTASAEKLERAIEKGEKAGKNMSAELEKLGKTKDNIKQVQDAIDKGLKPSFMQQQALVTELRNKLKRMSEDAPGYAEKFEAFRKAKTRLDEMSASFNTAEKAQRSWMSDAKTVAFGVLIGNTVQSALQAIGGYFSGIISGNAALSDSLSDIEKATGLSAEQVAKLNSQLGKIDTRTKTADLREIAVGLGQIGEAADKANVEAIDQIVVALGDEFGGGAREITTTLSVLRNNLSDIKSGNYAEDVTHIGNALNVLGAEGLATAPVVTDIATRIAGVGRTFKLSSGQILGVAATFQELGINSERGSTAFTKLMQKIGSEPEKFSKVAGVSVKKFKEMINTDMLGAFTAVAEGARKAGSDNVVFSQILKELDADGSGAGEVLSKLGANHELLTTKVTSASNALKDNGSIVDEFGKKNTNLAANLEKLSKDFNSLITSKSLADMFNAGVVGARHLIAAIKEIPTWLKENRTAVYLVIAGILTMNASYIASGLIVAKDSVIKMYNAAVTRGTAIASNIAAASQAAYAIVVQLVTGQITLATAATRIWNAALTIGAGPIGIVIALIGVLIATMGALKTEAEGAAKAEEDMISIREEASKATQQEKTNLEALLLVARDETKSKAERQKAIEAINKISPEYLGNITLENVNTDATKKAIDNYVVALDKKALAQAYMSKLQDLYNKQIEIESSSIEDNVAWYETLWNTVKNGGNTVGSMVDETMTGIQNRKENVKAIKEEIAALKEKFNADLKSGKASVTTGERAPVTPANNPFAKTDKADKKREKLLQEMADFQLQLQGITKVQEEKEIDRIVAKYNKLINEAKQYGLSIIELERAKSAAVAFLLDKEDRERKEKQQKEFKETAANEYDQALVLGQEYFDGLKQQRAEDYAAGKITKSQLEQDIQSIDRASRDQQVMIAEDYSANVKKAAEDVNKFKKQQRKEDTQDAIANAELQKDIERRNALAKAQRNVINASSPAARIQAQLELLRLERDLALQNEKLTEEEKAKIRDEFRVKEADTVKAHFAAQAQETLGYLSKALDIVSQFNSARDAKEKASLDKELKNNESRKASLKKLLDNRVITQQEYNRRLALMDGELDKKKEDLEKKQFERNKKIQIAQALVNMAMGITSVLAARPGASDVLTLGAFRAINIAFTVATALAQVASIGKSKYAKGGFLTGPSHSRGGMPVINPVTGGVEAEVEGGEVILSKNTVRNNAALVASLLDSSMHRNGERISPFWRNRSFQSVDFSGIARAARYFENGGVIPSASGSANVPADNSLQTETVKALNATREALAMSNQVNLMLAQTISDLQQKGVRATISKKQLDDTYSQEANMNDESVFR